MIKLIALIIFLNLYLSCLSQPKDYSGTVKFQDSFNKDSLLVNEFYELDIFFKNISNNNIKLFPKGIVFISHDASCFITYESNDRMMYILNNTCDYDSIVILKPGEEFKYTWSIMADPKFFFIGENDVCVFYRFENIISDNKKQRKNNSRNVSKENIALLSPNIKIKVYNIP
jgi:hypothetical protein